MSELLIILGAINKETKKYVLPGNADKKSKYVCPECDKDLMLCKGTKRMAHFRHFSDRVNPCTHYTSPSESQIHKDAKILIKQLFEQKKKITMNSCCDKCKKNSIFKIEEMTEKSKIEIEYSFLFNGTKKADVAYLNDDKISYIFEICHTHVTDPLNRPEPWFEINAKGLMHLVNDIGIDSDSYEIPCMRNKKCKDCLEKDIQDKLDYYLKTDIEKFVRLKLGLNFTSNKSEIKKSEYELEQFNCECGEEECKDCYEKEKWHEHLNILRDLSNYDYGEEGEIISEQGDILNYNERDDEDIIETVNIFKDLFNVFTIVLRARKGCLCYYIVLTEDFKKNDYWKGFNGDLDDWEMKNLEWLISSDEYCMYEGVQLFIDAVKDLIELESKTKKNTVQKPLTPENKFETKYVKRDLIVGIQPDIFKYFEVSFKNNDKIKNLGGKWHQSSKLWYVKNSIYEKNKEKIDPFVRVVNWN